ncbi:hypothetical protein [Exiguobacterium oxidotolerans]|uniref:hypothetical protein n=1 Tax=Exiguobacterium oxidotolerans TaxID=223958 RepID=UPI000494C22D|nr:hypothetical protein [Exiguobacterium oxidotolerans]
MKLRKRFLFGAGVLAGTGLVMKKMKSRRPPSHLKEYLDHLDQDESQDADKDEDEVGLTKLDSMYRSEWQANGFPRSQQELDELNK